MINKLFCISIFGDFLFADATPDNSMKFMKALNDSGATFLPNIIPEPFPQEPARPPMPRLCYADTTEKCVVRIMSNRIDVESSLGAECWNADVLSGRLNRMCDYMDAIWKGFPEDMKGNRLALYSEGIISVEDRRTLDAFCHKSTLGLSSYDGSLADWSVHLNSRENIEFGDGRFQELCNLIVDISLRELYGRDDAVPMAGLGVVLDLNTVPEKTTGRFDATDFRGFCNAIFSTHQKIVSEIEGGIS